MANARNHRARGDVGGRLTRRSLLAWAGATTAAIVANNGPARAVSALGQTLFAGTGPSPIKHLFFILLENRSFDHVFGYSPISGQEARTGVPTQIEGLLNAPGVNFTEKGQPVYTSPSASYVLPTDLSHEFTDVAWQLCGRGPIIGPYPLLYAVKLHNGEYPPLTNSGFVENYEVTRKGPPDVPMKCFAPSKLPILNALAREFVVCDHWFASHPGPTWPNRFFAHAASASGQADSPSGIRLGRAEEGDDEFTFLHGTIYDRIVEAGKRYRIYTSQRCSNINGINATFGDLRISYSLTALAEELQRPGYDYSYIFIEPDGGEVEFAGIRLCDTHGENDMHPAGDPRLGEELLRHVYETIRNSRYWESSALIVAFDEHGGFFDHVKPPPLHGPEDGSVEHTYGFKYRQAGVRVPALIISPWTAHNVIDHTTYDHTSVLATAERIFSLSGLTKRDEHANPFDDLFSQPKPRDTPSTLAPVDLHQTNVEPFPSWQAHIQHPTRAQIVVYSIQDTESWWVTREYNWWISTVEREKMVCALVAQSPELKDTPYRLPTWGGDFNGTGATQILVPSAAIRGTPAPWQLGTFDRGTMTWVGLMDSGKPPGPTFTEPNVGVPATWIADFLGIGRSQFLFYDKAAGDWWLGQLDRRTIRWEHASNTSSPPYDFGPLEIPVWTGDFSGIGRTQLLFYDQHHGNWWLGTMEGTGAAVTWEAAVIGVGFGDVYATTWIGDFEGTGQAQVLSYLPSKGDWFLGSFHGRGNRELAWSHVGNTSSPPYDFGQITAPMWLGDYQGHGRTETLFYDGKAGHWWLGTIGAGGLTWTLASETSNLNGTDLGDVTGVPLFVGDFEGVGTSQVAFYLHTDEHWWLGTFVNRTILWALREKAVYDPTSAPSPATPQGIWKAALQGYDRSLWLVGVEGQKQTGFRLRAGTSPSIAKLSSGGTQVAFQSGSGRLTVLGDQGWEDTQLTMMVGTSPSIAGMPGAGWQVAFQSSGGTLWALSHSDRRNTGQEMMLGTSPSIMAMPGGGWQVAFHSRHGALSVVGQDNSRHDTKVAMRPGTSPAIAALPGGGWQAAVHGNTGTLWLVDSGGSYDTGHAMMAGTSPSITAMPGAGWEVAFQADTGTLWVIGRDNRGDTQMTMQPGTSPSIAAMAGGAWEVAFQANTGEAWIVGADARGAIKQRQMLPGTQPSLATDSTALVVARAHQGPGGFQQITAV